MRLTVFGFAGSYPRADSPCSSYLLEANGFRLLVDLGNGALSVLQRHIGIHDVDAVLVSHLHSDHWADLAPYAVAWRYAPEPPDRTLPVYGPAATAERLAAVQDGEPEEFDIRPLRPGKLEIGPFALRTAVVDHPVETYACRFENAGRALTYSADTGPCGELVDLARGADAFLCEASFVDDPANTPHLHMSGRDAGEHAARAEVGRLLLTHLVAWNDDVRVHQEAAAAFAGRVDRVASGATYEI
jgi:ribonuclease BN (tRNA processing enzyme)